MTKGIVGNFAAQNPPENRFNKGCAELRKRAANPTSIEETRDAEKAVEHYFRLKPHLRDKLRTQVGGAIRESERRRQAHRFESVSNP